MNWFAISLILEELPFINVTVRCFVRSGPLLKFRDEREGLTQLYSRPHTFWP